jgi:hypothetical protein
MHGSARELNAAGLLLIWEHGRPALPAERALLLLEAFGPSLASSTWTIGQRDAALFELRRDLFGDTLECMTRCSACRETLELELHTDELLALRGEHEGSLLELEIEGRRITVRLPTQADVLAVGRRGEDGVALLERCVLDASDGANVATMSPETIDSISAAIAEADPLADLELAVACPACGERWIATFDIASFLWAELESWAHRTLREVHALAAAYGWSETEILSLSAARRAAYIELVGA